MIFHTLSSCLKLWLQQIPRQNKRFKYFIFYLIVNKPQPNLHAGNTCLGSGGVPWIEGPLYVWYRIKDNYCSSKILIQETVVISWEIQPDAILRIPRINTTTCGKHSIRYIGPVICSKLCIHIKSFLALASFKNKVRKVDAENPEWEPHYLQELSTDSM